MDEARVIRLGIQFDGLGDLAGAVESAVAAEQAGYDFVVVPQTGEGSADTWTLLSWIAARTERIGLVAVGVDASRPPAVIARSAAGLDLLSAGRLTVGFGGDEPFDDIVAIVRKMWDASRPEVHHTGRHVVAGAAAGPAPAHEIALWIGGDSGLDLAARVADGWIDRLDVDGAAPLTERLRRLGGLATDAGRDPRELNRVVSVPASRADATPEQLDELAALVVDHGVTTFLLRLGEKTSVGHLEKFIGDVGPTLEAAAQAAVAAGVISLRPLRRADVRERRRPGIDYDGLPESLATTAVEPGDLGYGAVRSTYLRAGRPGLVLRPQTVAEVVDAVAFADRHRHVPLGVRSGGHGISGRSTNDGGLVIDVGALKGIEVIDADRRLVRIGPGARWKQVATALQPYGWALGSGDYGGVGVGGLATAGGIGYLGRLHGLTIDHLSAVEMVLADGSVVRANEDENPELFWAVRGAGANFGIATSFEFVVDPVPDVGWAQLTFQVADPEAFLVDFGRVTTAAARETTPFLIMGESGTVHVLAMVASDDPEFIVLQLQPFAEIAPMVQQQVVITSYADVMNMFPDTPHQGFGEPVSRSGLVDDLTPEVAAAIARLLSSGASHFFQIRSMGGAIGDVDADATAFSHRGAQFSISAMGANAQRLDRFWNEIRPLLNGVYLSFETDTGPDRVAEAFPPPTLTRLRSLKSELDPTHLFRDNFDVAVPAPARSSS